MGFKNPMLSDESTCLVIVCSTPRESASVDLQLCCGVNLPPLGSGAGSSEGWAGLIVDDHLGRDMDEGGGGCIAISGWMSTLVG